MKLYLANKVTAPTKQEEEQNREWFNQTERMLTGLGVDVWNPMSSEHEHPNLSWEEYIVQDLAEMREYCDAIYMGADWQESVGARVERAEAMRLGFEVHYEVKEK